MYCPISSLKVSMSVRDGWLWVWSWTGPNRNGAGRNGRCRIERKRIWREEADRMGWEGRRGMGQAGQAGRGGAGWEREGSRGMGIGKSGSVRSFNNEEPGRVCVRLTFEHSFPYQRNHRGAILGQCPTAMTVVGWFGGRVVGWSILVSRLPFMLTRYRRCHHGTLRCRLTSWLRL